MRIFLTLFSIVFSLAMIAAIGATAWAVYEFKKPGPLPEPTLVTIRQGSGLSTIARDLSSVYAIDNPFIFKLGVRVSGADSELKAGEYKLDPAMSNHEIMTLLREGSTFQRRITIREGLTVYEVIRRLNDISALTGDITIIPDEGLLLPETYSYSLGEDRQAVLARMETAMSELRTELITRTEKDAPVKIHADGSVTEEDDHLQMGGNTLPLSLFILCMDKDDPDAPLPSLSDDDCWNNVLTLASIVEKETGVPSERQRVAGVFLNRLKRGIALQTDPTVIYAITRGQHEDEGQGPLGRRLLRKDLSHDSPYNTYLYPGLPPGPIANPGREAVEAVLAPETHDYIYFVADGTGGHAFAKTLDEHNDNVAKWRRIRSQN